MTDLSMTQQAEPVPALAGSGDDGGETDAFTMDSIVKKYFSPDNLQEAQDYLATVTSVCDEGTIKRNFEASDPFPEGYGLAIVPISRRGSEPGSGNIAIGVVVAAIPDPEIVAAHEKGGEFIRSAIVDVFMAKVANACRPRPDGTVASTFPFSIEDFIESRRGRENMKAFSEIASIFVKALREKGIRYMTPQLLRQTLQSTAFAEAQFEKISQSAWQRVLDAMIVKAKAEGLDPAILVNWKKTRDQIEMMEIGDLDLDDLDEMVA